MHTFINLKIYSFCNLQGLIILKSYIDWNLNPMSLEGRTSPKRSHLLQTKRNHYFLHFAHVFQSSSVFLVGQHLDPLFFNSWGKKKRDSVKKWVFLWIRLSSGYTRTPISLQGNLGDCFYFVENIPNCNVISFAKWHVQSFSKKYFSCCWKADLLNRSCSLLLLATAQFTFSVHNDCTQTSNF